MADAPPDAHHTTAGAEQTGWGLGGALAGALAGGLIGRSGAYLDSSAAPTPPRTPLGGPPRTPGGRAAPPRTPGGGILHFREVYVGCAAQFTHEGLQPCRTYAFRLRAQVGAMGCG